MRFQNYCARQCISRQVNLSNLMIRNNTTIELSRILKVNTNIAYLVLSGNRIGDENVSILCEALKFNHTVVHLDV
jgi:hypothetical protein